MIRVINILTLVLTFGLITAQEISVSLTADEQNLDLTQITEGRLTISAPGSVDFQDITFPVFESYTSLNDTIELYEVSEPVVESSNQLKTYTISFKFAAFWDGKRELGPFLVMYKGDSIKSNVVLLDITKASTTSRDFYRGIKPIVVDPLTTWEVIKIWFSKNWLILVIILLILLLAYGAYITWQKISKKEKKEVLVPIPVTLLEQLVLVEQKELWQNNEHKLYYSEVTDIIRKWIEYRFRIQAMEQTSGQILSALKVSDIENIEYNELQSLFKLADIIKFAKSTPTPVQNERAMELAKSLLNREVSQLGKK